MNEFLNLPSGAANSLIKKVSKFIGGVAKPYQIVRVEKAKAKASKIKAESDIEIDELYQRAENRRIEEDVRQQKNMESVVNRAIPHLNENSDPSGMDDDWINNLFNKCRTASNEEMQELWARILAGEANNPNTFSKRTVNLVMDLDKGDAELFRTLCRFRWIIDGVVVPVVTNMKTDIYQKYGITFESLSHLESINLITFSSITAYQLELFNYNAHSISAVLTYYNRKLELSLKHGSNMINTGFVLLTKIGKELALICEGEPIEGFFEYVKEHWKDYSAKEHIR